MMFSEEQVNDIVKEMANMPSEEQVIVFRFMTKLKEAFDVEGLDKLKDSDNIVCKEIYNIYEQLNGTMTINIKA